MWKRGFRTVFVIAAAGLLVGAVVQGQSRPSSAAPPQPDALLMEIKALRADLNTRLDASIRAQLLVARLQLQEGRIAAVSRQLADIHTQLQNNERGKGPLEAQLKLFEAAQAEQPNSGKKDGDFVVDTLRTQVEAMTRTDEDLRRQQAYLTGVLTDEQSRWAAFNARLEELEQLLAPGAPPRRDR